MPVVCVPIILIILVVITLGVLYTHHENKKKEEAERRRKEVARKRQEERKRELEANRKKYVLETPARRALILQLYAESLDLKEITFILRKAGYRGVTGEEITMKEIMDEHAMIQIEQHKKTLEEDEQEQKNERQPR